MIDKQFKKEAFKESVKENVKFLYRKKLEEATQEQIFQAVCYTVKDVIIDNWLETQNAYKEQDPKTVYYMSMEFLMGIKNTQFFIAQHFDKEHPHVHISSCLALSGGCV